MDWDAGSHGAKGVGKDHGTGVAMSLCGKGGRRSRGSLRGSHGGGDGGLGSGQRSAAGGAGGCVLEVAPLEIAPLEVAPPNLPNEALLLQLSDALGVHRA